MIKTADTPPPPPRRARDPANREADLIGRNLRSLYDGVANEALPPKFLDLLEQLTKGEGK